MFDWDNTEPASVDAAAGTQSGATLTQGIIAGTRVGSHMGWRAVEAIAPGDRVLTFDHGMVPVLDVRRQVICFDGQATPQAEWPILLPKDVLANRVDLTVLHGQGILIESDVADETYEDPFAIAAASMLEGWKGVRRVAVQHQFEVVTLVFAQEQVVYAEGGLLLLCPQAAPNEIDTTRDATTRYPRLTPEIADMVLEELSAALQDDWTPQNMALQA